MVRIFLLLLTFSVFAHKAAFAQTSDYKTGPLPGIEKFETLTLRERRLDSLTDHYNKEELQMLHSDSAFVPGTPAETKAQLIDYTKTMAQNYRDNRSRYFMDQYVNGILKSEIFEGIDTLTTPCDCYLSGDTIHVRTGMWVFGGFMFSIEINKDKFSSSYWEDHHKQNIFKTRLSDSSMSDNVQVHNIRQELILAQKPGYKLDENISGYLRFRTDTYYRTTDYKPGLAKDGYEDKTFDRIFMDGYFYFKCRLRKKTFADER